MTKSQILGLYGMALCALCSAPGTAMAERESSATALEALAEDSDATREDGCPAWKAASCRSDQLRWRLCERGLGEKPLASLAIQQCFLRSN
jgi:hypothetical protein